MTTTHPMVSTLREHLATGGKILDARADEGTIEIQLEERGGVAESIFARLTPALRDELGAFLAQARGAAGRRPTGRRRSRARLRG